MTEWKATQDVEDETRYKKRLGRYSKYLILSVWTIVVAFPIYWIVATSFKPDKDWFAWPPVYWSEDATLNNYAVVWLDHQEEYEGGTQYSHSMQKPWKALRNSLIISLLSTAFAVGFGTILAYGVSRYQILSEGRMFQLLMLRMVPPIVIVAPLSLYYSALHLLDTITGLVIIYSITTLPYAVWMIKSFIDELPREIEQAVMILGASRLRTLWEIHSSGALRHSGLFLFILILTIYISWLYSYQKTEAVLPSN